MNDAQQRDSASACATTIAVGSHVAFSAVYVLQYWLALRILPSVIRSYENFDAQLPPSLLWLVNLYSFCASFWFLLWLPALALLAVDGWIFYRLFRNPLSRFLAVTWFLLVSLAIVVLAAVMAIAMWMPLNSLMDSLS